MNEMMEKKRLLIVDDEPVNIDVLYHSLKNEYKISIANNGKKALKIANSKQPPDLILLDIMMPEMDGYEVCKRLKKDKSTRKIPVIFLTGKNEVGDEVKGLELGASDYITKPFTTAIVKARVKTLLDRDFLEELVKDRTEELMNKNKQLEDLLNKQHISIDLAKKMLNFVNGHPKRYIGLSNNLSLFIDAISIPCYAEGGDHLFVRTIEKNTELEHDITLFSLKDQSGHEVECVLRSILTDLMHNSIIFKNKNYLIENIIYELNNQILSSDIFLAEDYFTSINGCINHDNLMLKYLSTGHPLFLIIRNNEVIGLPDNHSNGSNMPVGMIADIKYTAAEFQLEIGDKLIFYTDGLTEMPLGNLNKMIEFEELKSYVKDIILNKKLRVSDIMYELINKVSSMCNEEVILFEKNTSGDDITMLCMEIESKEYENVIFKTDDFNVLNELRSSLYERLEKKWIEFGFNNPDSRLRLCLEEIVSNAWKHGNKRDPQKEIRICFRFGNDFHLKVTDQGDGFDYKSVPDPTANENLLKSCGRGIYIMRHISDNIGFRDGGRTVSLVFKKHSNKKEKEYLEKNNKLMCIWNQL